jgi:hypothetical protein
MTRHVDVSKRSLIMAAVHSKQDIACCKAKFPGLICRPALTQFMGVKVVALFELAEEDGDIKIQDEKHYKLVPNDFIDDQTKRAYGERS